MDYVQCQIMTSYCKYPYLLRGTNRKSACCRYFNPVIRISSQNKQHLHSRLPGFLLSLWCKEAHCRKIGISETTTLYRKSDLCIPRNEIVQSRFRFLQPCIRERFSKIGRLILGIYKYLTDPWMWILKTEHYNSVLEIKRPHSFISGNT